ncbi:MAG TPA: caspase family protein [Ensifer sp.]|jgi:hypothetical protein|uniref:caspase family protein n=1 Tax=Ensifer sp. TaxID=1872086 RepID=UPI002E1677C7|nr:caspase family protein [Ensifer sp.]
MRILLAVGCDQYDYKPLSQLHGAESDAAAIFDHLVTKGWGEYDKARSRLLRSPSLAEIQNEVSAILFNDGRVVEFTFFFAGHGGVKDGAYFLCAKDSDVSKLSMTSLSMTQLFAWLNEAKVAQTNIIIDACQSGGVVHDISTLLNPNVIGKVGSLALSILAASGSDEYAGEIDGGGICTSALLSCLRGDIIVQTTRPTLDLVEVGKVVSETLGHGNQTPVYWGINLYGRARLAKNPKFAQGAPHIAEAWASFTPNEAANDHIRANADKIWGLYISLARGFDADRFFEVLEPLCDHFANEIAIASSFVEGLANTFGPRIRQNGDLYDEAQLYAACVASLMKLIESGNVADQVSQDLIRRTVRCVNEANEALLSQLRQDKYALLAPRSGFSDLYFLPLRVLSVFGWIGAAAQAATLLGQPTLLSRTAAADLVELILAEYSQSVVAVSDEQAPFYVAFVAGCDTLDCAEAAELTSGYLFSTLCDSRGQLAASRLTGDQALAFLDAKISGNYADIDDTLARPTSLLPALILHYHKMGMPDLVDRAIRTFDHVHMNIFTPFTYRSFCDPVVDGINYSYQVGHSIWRTADLVGEWRNIRSKIDDDPALKIASLRVGALLVSLLRPDREAWFNFN